MDRKHNSNILPFARELRKNMTKEERHLWFDFLRNYPEKITRQKVLGKYIADFYCAKAKLAIELDGSQHYNKSGKENDEKRTDFLNQYDIKVLRISNFEINDNFEGVCVFIDKEIKKRTTTPQSAAADSSPCTGAPETLG